MSDFIPYDIYHSAHGILDCIFKIVMDISAYLKYVHRRLNAIFLNAIISQNISATDALQVTCPNHAPRHADHSIGG